MLSYRHSFHAGNFADVIKHIVLIEILGHLTLKDAPFDYIDTHAGAGLYDLHSEQAAKLGEYRSGIARMTPGEWPLLKELFTLLAGFNPEGELRRYPGSPLIARCFLRARDRAWLFELHPADFAALQEETRNDRRIRVAQEDGFTGLMRLLPPVSRRALVLIDPSYEIKTDFTRVVDTVTRAWKKFAGGIYVVWYPVVDRSRVDAMEQAFRTSGIRDIQQFELAIAADSGARGLTGAGMFVVNPPWPLMQKMRELLPGLVELLAQGNGAFYRADVLVPE